MTYFPESSVIISSDGIQFKTFSNQHPDDFIIAKPKYIPTDEIYSKEFILTSIFNKDFNRLDFWKDEKEVKYYLNSFKKIYGRYLFYSEVHKNWFFVVPKNLIKQVFDPKKGLQRLFALPKDEQGDHIENALEFVKFLSKSGVSLDKFGITFSTLLGYHDKHSDINVIIYGKKNGWKVINFLKFAKNPKLRWKTNDEWEKFRLKRKRSDLFSKEEFLKQMSIKKTEGFFNHTLFVLFPIETEEECWENWNEEEFFPDGIVEVEGIVVDNYNSLVRPGFYEIKNSKILEGRKVPVKRIVFYSRDYVMQASLNEKIRAKGILEKVVNKKTNKHYYRLVVGYFDSYLSERREKEYIRLVK